MLRRKNISIYFAFFFLLIIIPITRPNKMAIIILDSSNIGINNVVNPIIDAILAVVISSNFSLKLICDLIILTPLKKAFKMIILNLNSHFQKLVAERLGISVEAEPWYLGEFQIPITDLVVIYQH